MSRWIFLNALSFVGNATLKVNKWFKVFFKKYIFIFSLRGIAAECVITTVIFCYLKTFNKVFCLKKNTNNAKCIMGPLIAVVFVI